MICRVVKSSKLCIRTEVISLTGLQFNGLKEFEQDLFNNIFVLQYVFSWLSVDNLVTKIMQKLLTGTILFLISAPCIEKKTISCKG